MLSECIGRFAELVFPEEGIGITEEKKVGHRELRANER
jgi:hypothetical protein